MRILIVEDEPGIYNFLKQGLEEESYAVDIADEGKRGLQLALSGDYDLLLLDWMLPGLSGIEICRQFRIQYKDTPIIFLTARNLQDDKITGLKIGGDDYMTKPFSIEELVLRIKIFLKRNAVSDLTATTDIFKCGLYEFCFSQQTLTLDETITKLTHREAEVLKFLCERKNQISKREDILTAIWGRDDYFLGRSMDVFVTRIRKMLSGDENIKIENIHGVGFKLNC